MVFSFSNKLHYLACLLYNNKNKAHLLYYTIRNMNKRHDGGTNPKLKLSPQML